jgi:surfactin family lipopeptide synthetase C
VTTATANVESIRELSPLQEGLLVESLAAPGAGLYLEQVVVALEGAISMPAMARAWQAVAERHEVLRTSFHWRDLERPIQVVHRRVRVPVSHNDLRPVPAGHRAEALRWFLRQDKTRAFEFATAPLLRVAVLRHGPAAHHLVITMHHILLDGWSLQIVLDEVGRLYREHADLVPARLHPAPSYAGYIDWLRGQDEEAAERFWRRELGDYEGAPSVGRLSGRNGRAAPAHDHAELELPVPRAIGEAARSRARSERVTLNTVVLGAWALVLGAELQVSDLVVGAVVSGREAPLDGIEAMVGLCINTIPVRVPLDGDRPAGAWLADLHRRQLEMRDYQHCALTSVHGWSGAPRGRPLFESIFIFENHAPAEQGRSAGGRAFERTNYPLTVIVGVTPELTLRLLYDASVVEPDVVRRLAGRLVAVLGELGANAQRPLRELRATPAKERAALLALGRGREAPVPDRCVHELFDERAGLVPGAVALIDGDERVTFGELRRRSDGVAQRLRARGVDRGIVGVFMERSADAVAAILGVLKAGAAYLPLEPGEPSERLRFMLADSEARLVVTTSSLVPSLADVDVLAIDDPDDSLAEPPPAVVPGVAWVLFTSGSSGVPKGVLGSHVGLVNRLGWGLRVEPFVVGEVCCAKSRLGFVDSVCELFLPLVAGVPVVVADEQRLRDPRRLVELLVRERVSRLVAVPSLLRVMFEVCGRELAGSSLRSITASGEPLTGADVRRIRAVLPTCRVWNIYGCTEVAADATAHEVTGVEERVPIGRPMDNVTVQLLGPAGEPVPIGAIGEITIGGLGVSPGYVGHAAGHQDRFTTTEAGRSYRTGDLGRWRADGTLEHLGRADRQIKIRGIRAEPGEIEHALTTHPNINHAAITTRVANGDTEIVAFYTGDPDLHDLRRHLRAKLPEQLVPGHLVRLDELPHLPNGKLDREALAKHTTTTSRTFTAPRTAAEKAVADAFADVLGGPRAGALDDFFALGGHSLLATRLASALGARFDVDVPLGLIFEHPVVADLARAIEGLLVADIRNGGS